MDGSDDKENLVSLTAREHFLIHWLLCRMNPENKKLAAAFWYMCNLKNSTRVKYYVPSSRMYAEAKELWIPYLKKYMSERHISDETKQKIRDANIGKKYIRTEEYRKKLSNARKGKKQEITPARIAKWERQKGKVPWNKGKKFGPLSGEHKQKVKDSLSKIVNPMKDPDIVNRMRESYYRNKEEKIKNGTYKQRVPWNKGLKK